MIVAKGQYLVATIPAADRDTNIVDLRYDYSVRIGVVDEEGNEVEERGLEVQIIIEDHQECQNVT